MTFDNLSYKAKILLYVIAIWIGSILITSPLMALGFTYDSFKMGYWSWGNYFETLMISLFVSTVLSCFVPILLLFWLVFVFYNQNRLFGAIQVTYFSVGLWALVVLVIIAIEKEFMIIMAFSFCYLIIANILAFLLIKPFNLHESNQ
jgi:hypothetical protein